MQAKRLPPKFEIEEKDLFEQDEELIHRHQHVNKRPKAMTTCGGHL